MYNLLEASIVLLIGISVLLYISYRGGTKKTPSEIVQPLLDDLIIHLASTIEVKDKKYSVLEDYALSIIRGKINKKETIRPSEYALLTDKKIREEIRPRLKRFYIRKTRC